MVGSSEKPIKPIKANTQFEVDNSVNVSFPSDGGEIRKNLKKKQELKEELKKRREKKWKISITVQIMSINHHKTTLTPSIQTTFSK